MDSIRYFQTLHAELGTCWSALEIAGAELPSEMPSDLGDYISAVRDAWEKFSLVAELGLPVFGDPAEGEDVPGTVVLELPRLTESGRQFDFAEDEESLRYDLAAFFRNSMAA